MNDASLMTSNVTTPFVTAKSSKLKHNTTPKMSRVMRLYDSGVTPNFFPHVNTKARCLLMVVDNGRLKSLPSSLSSISASSSSSMGSRKCSKCSSWYSAKVCSRRIAFETLNLPAPCSAHMMNARNRSSRVFAVQIPAPKCTPLRSQIHFLLPVSFLPCLASAATAAATIPLSASSASCWDAVTM